MEPDRRIELSFDITGQSGVPGRVEIATTITGPPERAVASGVVLVCCPGAGYRRAYWTRAYQPGPDFASYMAQRGHVVVAIDHLGMGDSTVPTDPDTVDLEAMGAAAAAVGRLSRHRATAGTLCDGLAPIESPEVVLIGHSMGGAVTIVSQAGHRAADRVAILGTTTQELAGLIAPDPDDAAASPEQVRARALQVRPPLLWGRPWDDIEPLVDYDREPFRPTFYHDDVPLDVILTDEADGTATPRVALLECATPPLFAPRAAAIDVPVLLAFGERDLSPDPAAEVAAFSGSNDITLFRLAGSAHCHNLASSREVLWGRLARWLG